MKILDRGEYKARAFKIVLPDGPYVILQTGYGDEPWDTVVKRLRENEPLWDYNAMGEPVKRCGECKKWRYDPTNATPDGCGVRRCSAFQGCGESVHGHHECDRPTEFENSTFTEEDGGGNE